MAPRTVKRPASDSSLAARAGGWSARHRRKAILGWVVFVVAVLIDATIVRAVLLPAAMTLLGDGNWYLPRWMDRVIRKFYGGGPKRTADLRPVHSA